MTLGQMAEEYLEMDQAEPVTMRNVRFPPSLAAMPPRDPL
jgi:hypothetical protein